VGFYLITKMSKGIIAVIEMGLGNDDILAACFVLRQVAAFACRVNFPQKSNFF